MTYRPSIAVVDDDTSVRKALLRLLRAAQMDVEAYPSGEIFLLSLQKRSPDCLVLDIRMPGMTGLELRDHLGKSAHRIPIVFITAHVEDVGVEKGPSGEFADILHKPFDEAALIDAIRRCMKRSGPN